MYRFQAMNKEVELYELSRRLEKAEEILDKLGFRRCSIPACNCRGYHNSGQVAQLSEQSGIHPAAVTGANPALSTTFPCRSLNRQGPQRRWSAKPERAEDGAWDDFALEGKG